MEILEPILLKSNFEEVNDILSNLKTVDDPNINPAEAVLPTTEKIITKARRVKLDSEELRKLKKEYEELNTTKHPKHIKMLPEILEEADIYEEVHRINEKAHSQMEEDIEGSFDIDGEESKSKNGKLQRPNSADIFKLVTPRHPNYRVNSNTFFYKVQSEKSIQGFHRLDSNNSNRASQLKLPPIFDTKNRANINADILQNFNLEASFDLEAPKREPTPRMSNGGMHKSYNSVKLDGHR